MTAQRRILVPLTRMASRREQLQNMLDAAEDAHQRGDEALADLYERAARRLLHFSPTPSGGLQT